MKFILQGICRLRPDICLLGRRRVRHQRRIKGRQGALPKKHPLFLLQSIRLARQLTNLPLLVRLDSGNDSGDNIGICLEEGADFIIKRNLRKESAEEWLKIAKEKGRHCLERPGKDVYYERHCRQKA